MEATGFLFDKSKIKNLLSEIRRRQAAARDYVFPLGKLGFDDSGKLVFAHQAKAFHVNDRTFCEWADAEQWIETSRTDKTVGAEDWKIEVQDSPPVIPLSGNALQQLLGRVNVPGRFYSYLTGKGFNDVSGNLVRELIQKDPNRRLLVRTLDGRCRAVLSNTYKILDNADLFFAAFEKFEQHEAEIWHARLSDDGMDLFGVRGNVSAEVTTDRTFDPGDGWASRWFGKAGDVHNPAVRITNSETGEGGLHVDLAILRRVCCNFNVWCDGVSQIHLGKILSADDGLLQSDETRKSAGVYVWNKVKDAITTAFDEVRFTALMARLNETTQQALPDPVKAVDNVVAEYEITDERKRAIEKALILSCDNSRFGLIQAVTEAAHTADSETAHRFEEIGAELTDMADSKFAALVAV